ncbi:hypothetical protein [Bosea sp. (in: a-proteobacteria)]|uniref:hypothetical protein n=1 Tax=Bosea sp. (in: a-proteobacteria) TaxID=1871050 RepID=UPI002FCABF00
MLRRKLWRQARDHEIEVERFRQADSVPPLEHVPVSLRRKRAGTCSISNARGGFADQVD